MPDRYPNRGYENIAEAAQEQRLAPALRAVDAFTSRYATTPAAILRDPALWNALTVQARGIGWKELKEALEMATNETGSSYPYATPRDVRDRIAGTLELTDVQEKALTEKMWRNNLDPEEPAELKKGLKLIGLDARDFGVDGTKKSNYRHCLRCGALQSTVSNSRWASPSWYLGPKDPVRTCPHDQIEMLSENETAELLDRREKVRLKNSDTGASGTKTEWGTLDTPYGPWPVLEHLGMRMLVHTVQTSDGEKWTYRITRGQGNIVAEGERYKTQKPAQKAAIVAFNKLLPFTPGGHPGALEMATDETGGVEGTKKTTLVFNFGTPTTPAFGPANQWGHRAQAMPEHGHLYVSRPDPTNMLLVVVDDVNPRKYETFLRKSFRQFLDLPGDVDVRFVFDPNLREGEVSPTEDTRRAVRSIGDRRLVSEIWMTAHKWPVSATYDDTGAPDTKIGTGITEDKWDHTGPVFAVGYRAAHEFDAIWGNEHPEIVHMNRVKRNEHTGALARIPDTLHAWVGRRYSLADRGLSPAAPKAGQVFLTTADPVDGMQACLILEAKGGQGADTRVVTAVHWLTGRRAGGQDILYGATFWKPTGEGGKQQKMTFAEKGQASLFGVAGGLPHIAQPLTPEFAAKVLHWHPDEQETGASPRMLHRKVGSYTVHYPATKKDIVAAIAKHQRGDSLSYVTMMRLAPLNSEYWREWKLGELFTALRLRHEKAPQKVSGTCSGPGCAGPTKYDTPYQDGPNYGITPRELDSQSGRRHAKKYDRRVEPRHAKQIADRYGYGPEFEKAIEDATRDLPPGEYEVTIH